MQGRPSLEVLEDPEAVARRAASFWGERARAAIAACARFSSALSGGRTPWLMFELLGSQDIPWESVDLYQTDERIAPEGDPDRSMTHLARSLPVDAFSRLHPMPVEDPDASTAADSYAVTLPP